MKKSAKTLDVTVTIEEVAKVRHFGKSENDGFIFILSKGLTNLNSKHEKIFNKGFNKPWEARHD